MEPALRNAARERLVAGELALGVGIRQSRTVDIAAIMKACSASPDGLMTSGSSGHTAR